MDWLVKWGVKKYVLNIVNTALAAHSVNVARARAIVTRYVEKAEALTAFLRSLDGKLADDVVTDDEADALAAEAAGLAKDLTS